MATYAYNGLNQRIQKLDQTKSPNVTTDYYYNEAWQVLEEQRTVSGSTASYAQYVWDPRYIDAPVCRFRDADGSPDDGLEETLYYTQDANCNVTALVNTSGGVVERYTYDAYGKVTFRQNDWSFQAVQGSLPAGAASAYDNQILYAGYRLDPESGLYQVCNRYYHPTLGRWNSRDPVGYVSGINIYNYVGSNPIRYLDPAGLLTDSTANAIVRDFMVHFNYYGYAMNEDMDPKGCMNDTLAYVGKREAAVYLKTLGKDLIIGPLAKAIPAEGLLAGVSKAVLENLADVAFEGDINQETIITALGSVAKALPPDELHTLTDNLTEALTDLAQTTTGKMLGPVKLVTIEADSSPLTKDQGLEVEGQFFVSAETSGLIWESYSNFHIVGTVMYTCKKGPDFQCCPCGSSGKFTVDATGHRVKGGVEVDDSSQFHMIENTP